MGVAPRMRGAALGEHVPHLFLSYSSKDKEWVLQLAEDLNLCGVDVWFDSWELRVGDDLHERIADAVAKSRFVAVVVTKSFSASKWIQGEVHQALSREKAEDRPVVLPLLAEDVSAPPVLSSKKFLDFGRDYFPSLAHLAGLIHDLPPDSIEGAMRGHRPASVSDCVDVLKSAGWRSRHVVGTHMLGEIERAGGIRNGDIVHFSAEDILRNPRISNSLRNLMNRLVSGRDASRPQLEQDATDSWVESRQTRFRKSSQERLRRRPRSDTDV
jgi:hypothetical protein